MQDFSHFQIALQMDLVIHFTGISLKNNMNVIYDMGYNIIWNRIWITFSFAAYTFIFKQSSHWPKKQIKIIYSYIKEFGTMSSKNKSA